MLPTEDLFVHSYVLIDDAIAFPGHRHPAARPGPVPACSNAGFLAEVARDQVRPLPVLPHQSEANRRIRRLWGAAARPFGLTEGAGRVKLDP